MPDNEPLDEIPEQLRSGSLDNESDSPPSSPKTAREELDDFENGFRKAMLNGTVPEFLHAYRERQFRRDLEEADRRFRGELSPAELAARDKQLNKIEPTAEETLQLLEAEFDLRQVAKDLGISPEDLLRQVDPDVPQHILNSLSTPDPQQQAAPKKETHPRTPPHRPHGSSHYRRSGPPRRPGTESGPK